MRLVHDRVCLDGKVAAAIRATVGRVFMAGLMGPRAAAMRAMATVRPNLPLEPVSRGLLVREHIGKLDDRNAFAIALSRGRVCHCLLPSCLLCRVQEHGTPVKVN